MCDTKWLFTEDEIKSRKCKFEEISAEKEMFLRQQAANIIQDLGQRLRVSQLCINTAIVYMHRFYAFHPFALFHVNDIAAAAFFLAAKVEEHPRKAEDVIKIMNVVVNAPRTEDFMQKIQELTFHENFLMETLGFDLTIEHPHVHVIRATQMLRSLPGLKDMGKIFYFMATNSLHMTQMCLKYPATVVGAFCIDFTCKWRKFEFPETFNGKAWYKNIDENISKELLEQLSEEYMEILEKSPSKIKEKIEAIMSNHKIEVPKPSTAHRHNQKPLQKKYPRITFDTQPKSCNGQSQEASKKNLLGKRPHQEKTENRQENLHRNNSQVSKQQNRLPEDSLKHSSDERSRKYTKYSSPCQVSSKSVHESSLKSSQAPTKRTFSSMSDGHVPEGFNRDSKMRKLESVPENLPTNQEVSSKIEVTSPQESATMNVLNVKMTLLSPLSSSNDPYELFLTQNSGKSSSSENLSQEEIFNFKQEVNTGSRSDFSNTAELINAV